LRLPMTEPSRIADSCPPVHDRTATTPINAHYFYTTAWAMRRIFSTRPLETEDVASQVIFAHLLAGIIPVVSLDYRPPQTRPPGLICPNGELVRLPL
jgi:hypothetical protein